MPRTFITQAKFWLWALSLTVMMTISTIARAEDPIEGVWLTKDGESHVKIIRCEQTLCNEIIWLKQPNGKNGQPLRDNLNKRASLKGRPIMGMPILENMKQVSKAMWVGQLYKPRHGKSYAGHVRIVSEKQLELKGCHAFLPVCKTQYWQKVRELEQEERQAAQNTVQ